MRSSCTGVLPPPRAQGGHPRPRSRAGANIANMAAPRPTAAWARMLLEGIA